MIMKMYEMHNIICHCFFINHWHYYIYLFSWVIKKDIINTNTNIITETVIY